MKNTMQNYYFSSILQEFLVKNIRFLTFYKHFAVPFKVSSLYKLF